MKRFILYLFMVSCTTNASAQTWKSISRIGSYSQNIVNQFSINPYTNDIWFVGLSDLAVIENEGSAHVFPQTFSPPFLWGSDLSIAFTPNHVYYAHDNYGLFSFDNYVSQIKHSFSDYDGVLRNDGDTVYILRVGDFNILHKYTETVTYTSGRVLDDLQSKNGYFYGDVGQPAYYLDSSPTNFVYLYTDPDYLMAPYNQMKFTRLSDTLFIGGKLGINKVFNYDVFDTITPNNTINMPSPNVLEMEWDMEDNLWAVFGDTDDKAFAIAKLENDTWVNKIDASNSPINFNYFYGLEIDTLNNLWVVDNNALHTLITPNSPAWLSTIEATEFQNFVLFPNPSSGVLNFQLENQQATKIVILDLSGRIVEEHTYSETIQTQLASGTYLVQLMNNELMVGQKQIVIQ